MSKDLPEFRRSVGITPAKVVDVQAPFNELSKVLEQFSQGAAQLATRAATERATQAGAAAGAAPDFKGNLAPGITAPTQAFNKAALAASKMQTQIGIRSSIQNIHDSITSPQNLTIANKPIEAFDDQAIKYWNSISPNIPKQNLQNAENYYLFEAGNARRSVVQRVNALNLNVLRTEQQAYQLSIQREATQHAFNRDERASAALAGQAHQNNQAAVEGGIINQDIANVMGENLRHSLQTQSILGGYQRALMTGSGPEYIKNYNKAALPDMNILQRTNLTGQLAGMEAVFEQTQGVNQAALRQQYVDHNSKIQSGDHISPTLAAQFPNESARFWREFEPKFAASQLINTGASALRYASLADRQTVLNSFIQKTLKTPADIDAQRVISAVQQISKKQLTAQANDPAGYNWNHPAFVEAQRQAQLQNTSQNQAETGNIEPSDSILKGTPTDVLLNIERSEGIPENKLSIIPNIAAVKLVQDIKQLPMDQQIKAIQVLGAQWGNNAIIGLRDLQKHGLPFATGIALSASNNTKSRGHMSDVIETYNETPTELKTTQDLALSKWSAVEGTRISATILGDEVTTQFSDLNASLDATNGSSTLTQSQFKNEAVRLALQFGAKGMGRPQALKLATDIVANNNYDFASQGEYAPLRVPHTEKAEDIRSFTGAAVTMAISQNLKIPNYISLANPGASQEELQKAYQEEIISTKRFISDPSGTRVILMAGPQTQGQPVLTADGMRIAPSYADMKSGTSRISELRAADPTPNILLRGISPQFRRALRFTPIGRIVLDQVTVLKSLGTLAVGGKLTSQENDFFRGVTTSSVQAANFGAELVKFAVNSPAQAVRVISSIPSDAIGATRKAVNNFVANLPPEQLAIQEAAFKKLQAALKKRKS